MKPRHADLLAKDLSARELIQFIDRFLMFYVRTADRLQRTSTWLENLEGGIDYVRKVVCEDSLGIGAELEADMRRHVETYACEWKQAIETPEILRRFHDGVKVCRVDEILPDTGVAALVDGEPVAVFRVGEQIHAVGNRDPFSGVNVLSRGIVGDLNGELVVASPLYKQHFSLLTGRCIEDPSVSVPVYRTRVEGADIQILKTGESPCRT